MKSLTYFDQTNGKIMHVYTLPPEMTFPAHPEYAALEGAYDAERQYVVNGKVVDRPIFYDDFNPTTIEAGDTTEIAGLPAGSYAFLENELATEDGGVITFSGDLIGEFTMVFEAFPYQRFARTVTVTEAAE